MEISLGPDEVMNQIKDLHERGETLSKKKVKKMHPQLMRSALHYFPDWDSAINRSLSE